MKLPRAFITLDKVRHSPPLFDAHFHIFDHDYPLLPNQGFLPDPFAVSDYRKTTEGLNLKGGAVVSASFQAFDQAYLAAALKQLGTHFVGVTQIPAGCPDDEILRLKNLGIRGVRFNLRRGSSAAISQMKDLSHRVRDLAGWHTELYLEARYLEDLSEILTGLPAASLDHLGLTQAGRKALLKLVEKGWHVKASGFGRCDFDVVPAMTEIYRANPGALMFGTDLPSTRAPRPFRMRDIRLIQDHFDDEAMERIFYKNAVEFYRIINA